MTDFDRIAPQSHLVPAHSIQHSCVMKNTFFLQVLSIGAITAALGGCVTPANLNRTSPMTAQKSQVVSLLKAIETGESEPIAVINPDKYIQHNLSAPDGLKGFQALVQAIPKGSARVNTVRVFQDGNYVFAHTDYIVFGPKIGFDVFRFEDGKIVEHWDTLQETPISPNPSGRTMIDGPTQAVDLEKTAANKLVARAFVEDVLVNGRVEKIGEYYDADIIQHHPLIPDTLPALMAVFGAWAKAGITVTHDRIHKVLGEGNFVLVLSEGHFAGKHTAFSDLFRVQNGKIAEHWSAVQEIPPRAEWKNGNGKF